jgi:hypothetical protein
MKQLMVESVYLLSNFEGRNEKKALEKMATLPMFTEVYGVCRFSLQYLWKGAVRITEKNYTHQRERLCMLWGNPVIFTDCGKNPIPNYHRCSSQSVNITALFHRYCRKNL